MRVVYLANLWDMTAVATLVAYWVGKSNALGVSQSVGQLVIV